MSKSNWQNRIVESGIEDASQLLANPFNARIHPQFQQQALEGVLDSVGWVQRVIVNKVTGHVVDGHLRVALAITRGEQVPVDYVELTEAEEKLILASFDYITTMAVYDREQLDALLQQVNSDDARVQEMLAQLADDHHLYQNDDVGEDKGAQIDRAEELQQVWNVERGQVWEIGKHRLLCGDSTSAEDVARVMGGDKSPLMVTDPPYNVAQDTDLYAQNRSKALKELANSDWDRDFNPIDFLEATKNTLSKDAWQYVFTAHHMFGMIFEWLNTAHAKTSFCVWCKPNPMPSLTMRTWTFAVELCLFGKSGSPVFNFPEGEHCLNWWPITKVSDGSHPTQKPTEVIGHIISHCSSHDDLVIDPFGGSGTTMVACEQLNRQCRMMEIEPKYCAVILQRMSDMGLTPRLVE